MEYIIPHQPRRPRLNDDGAPLAYRTRPRKCQKILRIDKRENQIAQMRLYRAVCQGNVPQQVSINDLYEYLFHDMPEYVSKSNLGYVVTNAVIYEPRKLINNKSVGKATMSYLFWEPLELQYGLEWQLCTWFHRYTNLTDMDAIEEELEVLGNSDSTEYMRDFEEGIWSFKIPYFDFEADQMRRGWSWIETIPEAGKPKMKQPPPPKNLFQKR